MQHAAKTDHFSIHLVFDFAEKVLLPSMLRQSGQLYFITGLKFDIFGVSSSSFDRNFIFGLPEGHWPGHKTASEITSMPHHALEVHRDMRSHGIYARSLNLHADNCAGQTKNRFILFYLALRVAMGFENVTTLDFLMAGHTKKSCDRSFGHIKRKLKSMDVHGTFHMFEAMIQSAKYNMAGIRTAVK